MGIRIRHCRGKTIATDDPLYRWLQLLIVAWHGHNGLASLFDRSLANRPQPVVGLLPIREGLIYSRCVMGYGQRDVIRQSAPKVTSFIQATAPQHQPLSEAARDRNRTKSTVLAKVEHAGLVITRIFGWTNIRYRGLARISTGSRFAAGWPICTWHDGACWQGCRGHVSKGWQWAIRRWVCPTKRLSTQQRPTDSS